MKVAIVGSRNADHIDIQKMIAYIPENCSEIISGGADGIDTFAREIAQLLHLPVREYLPQYDKFGKAAPLERNKQIAASCDLLLAFWDNHSDGTGHIIAHCIQTGVPFRIIPLDEVRLNP